MLAIAAVCELLHWQALSPAAQPTADAAEAMQETPQVGTAAMADAQGLPAEHEGPAVIGGALEAGNADDTGGAGEPPVGVGPAEQRLVGLALTQEHTAAAED